MKYLVSCISQTGFEFPISIQPDLESAIEFVKKQNIIYFHDRMHIYNLDKPLSVRYLDNKIFID